MIRSLSISHKINPKHLSSTPLNFDLAIAKNHAPAVGVIASVRNYRVARKQMNL